MYNNISDINRKIVELREQRDCLIQNWFERGETDRNYGLVPQYPDNAWYMSGYWDRDYQLEIGFNTASATSQHE